MAEQKILTKEQKILLKVIGQNDDICRSFYLTGGTALAEFYLKHRLSEDLDFFSEKEFEPEAVFIFLKSIQKQLGIKKIEITQSFNRHLFFLHLSKSIIKTEFTYFPFAQIAEGLKKDKLMIDSLLDIAVNKIFSIYQKPKARDYIDIHFILQAKNWSVAELVEKAKLKFDWHIDSLQLGAQFMQATKVKDYPKLIKKIDHQAWQNFFVEESKKLESSIF